MLFCVSRASFRVRCFCDLLPLCVLLLLALPFRLPCGLWLLWLLRLLFGLPDFLSPCVFLASWCFSQSQRSHQSAPCGVRHFVSLAAKAAASVTPLLSSCLIASLRTWSSCRNTTGQAGLIYSSPEGFIALSSATWSANNQSTGFGRTRWPRVCSDTFRQSLLQ